MTFTGAFGSVSTNGHQDLITYVGILLNSRVCITDCYAKVNDFRLLIAAYSILRERIAVSQ